MVEVIRKKKLSIDRDSFTGKKPVAESPAKVLDEKWLLRELKRLGWDEKTVRGILRVKRKLFRDEHISASAFGQIDGVNMNKKTDGLEIALFVDNWNISVRITSISENKRDERVDNIKRVLESGMPGMGFSAKRKKLKKNYEIRLAGAYNKPDKDCEGGKNVCKVQVPPRIPDFSAQTKKSTSMARGC